MDDIIKSIIDIDRGASKKLADAEREKFRIITAAKEMEETIIRKSVEESKLEIEKIEREEQQKADDKIASLKSERDTKIQAMKKSFEANSDKWCEDIFSAVISNQS